METTATKISITPITDYMGDDNFVKTDENYRNWSKLMPVVEKIHIEHFKCNVPGRDLMYAMNLFLQGGYKFGSTTPLPSLPLTLDNLYDRVRMYLHSML